jgi:hypothetical protein
LILTHTGFPHLHFFSGGLNYSFNDLVWTMLLEFRHQILLFLNSKLLWTLAIKTIMLWKKSESEMKYRLHVVMCRCELPKLRLLNFEASPFIDLRVTSINEDCLVEMISCKVFPL